MPLYIVIIISGMIGGTVGPLPYGMDECKVRAADIYATMKESAVNPDGTVLYKKDVRLECQFHAVRPEITVK